MRLVYVLVMVGRSLRFVGDLFGTLFSAMVVIYILGFLVALPVTLLAFGTLSSIGLSTANWLPPAVAFAILVIAGTAIGIRAHLLPVDDIRSLESPFLSYARWRASRIRRRYTNDDLNHYPDNWDELRRDIYRRDGYRCANCGAKDVELHAHHVVPLSVGGTNNASNLISLCRDCHHRLHPHMRD